MPPRRIWRRSPAVRNAASGLVPMAGRPHHQDQNSTRRYRTKRRVTRVKDEPLIFRRWRPGMALDEGGFGTRHPGPEAPEVTPEILLVPLLAFDGRGHRLGWGGGFYDRTLARLRARGPVVAVGVAFHGQQIDHIPDTPGDEPVDWVITEEDVLEIG